MADADFTLPNDLKIEIEGMDCISQHNNGTIEGMAKAIARLTDDQEIKALAKHIGHLAFDTSNVVNCAAERLGANYKVAGHD